MIGWLGVFCGHDSATDQASDMRDEFATDSCFIDVPAVVSSFYWIMLLDSSTVDSWLIGSSGADSYSYSFFSSAPLESVQTE